jgi:hypothetical protein
MRGLIQHVDQITAQDLQLRHHPVAVERFDRHLRATAAVGADPRDAALVQRAVDHLIEQTHAVHDVPSCAA